MHHENQRSLKVVFRLADSAIFSTTGKHLSNAEYIVLEGTLKGKKYLKIASENGYASEYLKNDIGPKLWKRLSQALGEKISKANVRVVLQQRLLTEENLKEENELRYLSNEFEAGEIGYENQSREFKGVDYVSSSNYFLDSTNHCLDSDFRAFFLSRLNREIHHNLPLQENHLVGRNFEMKQLEKWLNSDNSNRMSIEGIGGIGKTHLALNFAHQCLRKNTSNLGSQKSLAIGNFPVRNIIFTSAQSKHCTLHGLIPRLQKEKTLSDILNTLLRTIRCKSDFRNFEEICSNSIIQQVYHALMDVPTLLILDSFDEMNNRKEILGFLYGLPSTVKVLITSRDCSQLQSVRIESLSQLESHHLIRQGLKKSKIALQENEISELIDCVDGHPAGIIHVISLLAAGHEFSQSLLALSQSEKEFYHFYVNPLLCAAPKKNTEEILKMLALSPHPVSREFIARMSNADDLGGTLNHLKSLFLMREIDGLYSLNLIARIYAMHQLEAALDHHLDAINRWVSRYAEFINGKELFLCQRLNGKLDSEEEASMVREWNNLMEVLEWCIHHDCRVGVQKILNFMKCGLSPHEELKT